MKDKETLSCCSVNKKYKLIKFRNLKTSGDGFYIVFTPFYGANNKSVQVKFCPFCGKNLGRLGILT